MATTTGITEQIDIDTLSYILSLREKPGLHIHYPYGRKFEHSDWSFDLPQPVYAGCTIRVFINYRINAYAKLEMERIVNPRKSFGLVSIVHKSFQLHYGNNRDTLYPNPNISIEPGTFFSFGFRLSYMVLYALINKTAEYRLEMQVPIRNYDWRVKISSKTNYIVSVHVCDEKGSNFPPTGLDQQYSIRAPLPVGSHVTVFAVYTGNIDQTPWFTVDFRGDGYLAKGPTYNNVPLKANDKFHLTVRNSNKGWVLTASFLGENQTAIIVPHSDKEEFTDVTLSKNCYITRILAVC